MRNGLLLEGERIERIERIERRAPLNGSTTQRAAGHYVLASYRVGWACAAGREMGAAA
jgi:hypothetical protein